MTTALDIAPAVRGNLSFEEILGLLTYTPGSRVPYSKMGDGEYMRNVLRLALGTVNGDTIAHFAERAMAVYDSGVASPDDFEYVFHLGAAVLQIFGVSA